MKAHVWFNDAPLSYEAAQAERIGWFNKIAPKPNWKAPIAAWIDEADFENCFEAAKFFAGGGLQIVKRNHRKAKVFVKAPGYYAMIGA